MTEKLYEKDSYIKEFTANVKVCDFDGENYKVVLDRTAFAPEGGGQKADKGLINSIEVIDVIEKGEDIVHIIAEEIKVGETVECSIEWKDRFDKMQNHTGEHIVSGIIKRLFGFNNVGFHLGEGLVTLDVDGALTKEDVEKIEFESNQIVYQNKEIRVFYPTKNEQESLDFRSKISPREGLRLVEIVDCDLCACCAPHVSKTGQVGNVCIIDFSPHRGGTRLTLVCGEFLLNYLKKTNETLNQVYKSFSANSQNVMDKISLLKEETQKQKAEIQALKNQLILSKLTIKDYKEVVFAITEDATFDSLRFALNKLLEENQAVMIISKNNDGILYMLSSKNEVAEKTFNSLKEKVIVKGGFRNNFSQGKIEGSLEQIEKALN